MAKTQVLLSGYVFKLVWRGFSPLSIMEGVNSVYPGSSFQKLPKCFWKGVYYFSFTFHKLYTKPYLTIRFPYWDTKVSFHLSMSYVFFDSFKKILNLQVCIFKKKVCVGGYLLDTGGFVSVYSISVSIYRYSGLEQIWQQYCGDSVKVLACWSMIYILHICHNIWISSSETLLVWVHLQCLDLYTLCWRHTIIQQFWIWK